MVIKILIIVITVLSIIAASFVYFWLSELIGHDRYVKQVAEKELEYEQRIDELEKMYNSKLKELEHTHLYMMERRPPIYTLAAKAIITRPFGYEISEEEKEAIIKSIIKNDISEQLLKAAEVITEYNPIDQSTTFCVRINTIPGDQHYEDYTRYSARES